MATSSKSAPYPPPKVCLFWPPSLRGNDAHICLNFLHNARARYGDIYTLDLGLKQVVILNHPRHAHHLFRDYPTNYVKGGSLMTPLRAISGAGVTTSGGQQWQDQRRMIQPFFQRTHIAAQVTTILATIEESLAAYLSRVQPGTPINGSELLAILTAQITAATLFHTTLPVEQIQIVNGALKTLNHRALQGIFQSLLPRWMPLPGRRRYQQAIHEVDQTIAALLATRPRTDAQMSDLQTVLQTHYQTRYDPSHACQQLQDDVLALFIAGYETTATCLSWTCYLLSRHPVVLLKLQQELAQCLGSRQPTYDDLAALPYLTMILYESLRLYPPSWRLSRVAVADDVIDGFQIKKGQSVITLVYMIHRQPDLWRDPDLFIPERFADREGALPRSEIWLPFGMGSRKCVGQDLALVEMKLILITLLQRYQFTAHDRRHPGLQLAMTLKPRRDLWLTLTPRASVG